MVQKERRMRSPMNGRFDFRRTEGSVVVRNWTVEDRVLDPPEDYKSRKDFVDSLIKADFMRLKDRMVNVTGLFRDLMGYAVPDGEIRDFVDELETREIAPVFKRSDIASVSKTYFVLAWDYERLTGKIWESKDSSSSTGGVNKVK